MLCVRIRLNCEVTFIEIHNARGRIVAAALASEASGQRGNSLKCARRTLAQKPGSSARAALASEASGQRGNSQWWTIDRAVLLRQHAVTHRTY
jgi:hypothetical protein